MEIRTQHADSGSQQHGQLRQTAMRLEGAFLAEMLRHGGAGRPRTDFGGGVGEDAFASMLAREQADHFAQAGGIGLAEAIFASLQREGS